MQVFDDNSTWAVRSAGNTILEPAAGIWTDSSSKIERWTRYRGIRVPGGVHNPFEKGVGPHLRVAGAAPRASKP